jgi:hypothetical protein
MEYSGVECVSADIMSSAGWAGMETGCGDAGHERRFASGLALRIFYV